MKTIMFIFLLSTSVFAETINLLGEKLHPEGIAYRKADHSYYVGSAANGSVQIIKDGKAKLLQSPGQDGRVKTLGLKVDELRKRLWLVDGKAVYVYHLETQVLVKKLLLSDIFKVTDSALNDLALDQEGNAFITDSFNPYIYKVNCADLSMSIFANVSKANFGKQNDFPYNFNGIVFSPNFTSLYIVKTNDGTLWNLDVNTKALVQVQLHENVTKGDGLVMTTLGELYVIRNFENKVSKIELEKDMGKKSKVSHVEIEGLATPTTAIFDEKDKTLVIVNSQFGKEVITHPFTLVTKRIGPE